MRTSRTNESFMALHRVVHQVGHDPLHRVRIGHHPGQFGGQLQV